MLAIKRNMNKTDILHNVVLTDPPDRVVMRSAISQRARPELAAAQLDNQFRLWREAVRPQPVHLCPSTPPHKTTLLFST